MFYQFQEENEIVFYLSEILHALCFSANKNVFQIILQFMDDDEVV